MTTYRDPTTLEEAMREIRASRKAIERLRERAEAGAELWNVLQRTLAEVERLRTERDEAKSDLCNLRVAFNDWKVFHSTARLEAENIRLQAATVRLRAALVGCEHQTHSLRVWAGSAWSYHPPQAERIARLARAAIDSAQEG